MSYRQKSLLPRDPLNGTFIEILVNNVAPETLHPFEVGERPTPGHEVSFEATSPLKNYWNRKILPWNRKILPPPSEVGKNLTMGLEQKHH